jgi:cell division protein FtsW
MSFWAKYIKIDGDKSIWIVVFFLMLISILVVYSATGGLAYTKFGGDTMHLITKHLKSLVAGVIGMYFVHKIPSKYFSRLGQFGFYVSILVLLYTLFFGASINDANRWIKIGGTTIQTFDIAKLSIIVFSARQLIKYKDCLGNFKKVFFHIFLPLIIICGLIFPANFSTAAILFSSGILLFYFGGVSLSHLFILTSSIITLGGLAILLSINVPSFQEAFPRSQTWVNRVKNFSNTDDALSNRDDFHQVVQAKIALVNGGIKGRGPGKSIQRNVLPHPYSDYVYAIIIEEYGLIGGFFVLILYIILMVRGKRIFDLARDGFVALLGIGLSMSLVLQALIHMAVNVDFFPVTGQTLPLISMGGVSVFFTCLTLGIILSVSKELNISRITS